jgi:hypothetical protein
MIDIQITVVCPFTTITDEPILLAEQIFLDIHSYLSKLQSRLSSKNEKYDQQRIKLPKKPK